MKNIDKYLEYFSSKEPRQSFQLLGGLGNVIISAPHSVEQFRNGQLKFGEYDTGVLIKCLHEELNCPVIYKSCNYNDDANYDAICDYKSILKSYINNNSIDFLIDLHELHYKREADIELGTGNGNNIKKNPIILSIIQRNFAEAGFSKLYVDNIFDASYPYTVSAYIARECNISCLQIEINSKLLCKHFDEYRFYDVYRAIKVSVKELNNYYEGNPNNK